MLMSNNHNNTNLILRIIALHLIESCNKANHYNCRGIKSLYQVNSNTIVILV